MKSLSRDFQMKYFCNFPKYKILKLENDEASAKSDIEGGLVGNKKEMRKLLSMELASLKYWHKDFVWPIKAIEKALKELK